MTLQLLNQTFTVCQLNHISDADLSVPFTFLARTDEEISLVCPVQSCPSGALNRQDGWKCLRIAGVLDFSLIGILSKISTILAENQIGIFAVSTYNTDYILVKKENFDRAMEVLSAAGYEVEGL